MKEFQTITGLAPLETISSIAASSSTERGDKAEMTDICLDK